MARLRSFAPDASAAASGRVKVAAVGSVIAVAAGGIGESCGGGWDE